VLWMSRAKAIAGAPFLAKVGTHRVPRLGAPYRGVLASSRDKPGQRAPSARCCGSHLLARVCDMRTLKLVPSLLWARGCGA
jgi:hypothetical protein